MAANPLVVCVGHAALDLIYRVDALPARPTKVPAQSLTISGGGMAANAACAIVRLGGAARQVGAIGDDVFGDLVVAELQRYGVDVTHLERVGGASTSVSSIVVEASGERLIVNHRGSALDSTPPDVTPTLAGASAVLCDPRWPAASRAALVAARAWRIPSVLDADVADPAILAALVPLADHVVFSEPGYARWSGHAAESPAALAALASLVGPDCVLAAVTLGERGILYATARGVARMPAFDVEAVETLGAGDVFHGAYALGLAEGAVIEDALRFASAAAAQKCRRAGGRAALPDRDAVRAYLGGR
jgi:sulfofructose kinase